jgi:hypothetical protein
MGHVRPALAIASLIAACVACARSDGSARHHRERVIAASHGPAPAADFLVLAGDSTFWVTSGANGIRVRGAPLILARVNDRFYELYVADDDRSYYDAVFTGQRIYRRDIERGDSVSVFEDTAVAAAAHAYALAHPNEAPLDSDEDAADNPTTSVTGDIDLLDSYGPYLSFEYHGSRGGHAAEAAAKDSSGSGSEWVMRGVIDLLAARGATVQEIFGQHAGDSAVALGRRSYAAALDTIRAHGVLADDRAKLAAQALSDFVFDPKSFVLTDVERDPAIAFFVPGRGRQGGRSLGLPPVRMDAPTWWSSERELLPATGKAADTAADFWRHPPIVIRARYDTAGAATVTLVDDQHREWVVGALPAPIRRVYWLDDPTVDPEMRRALTRAFDESALYSDDARAARRVVHPLHPIVHYVTERR